MQPACPAKLRAPRRPPRFVAWATYLQLALAGIWATAHFARASHAPSHAQLSTGEEALDAWQLEDALALAAAALHAEPDAPRAQIFAAEALHQRGQHATAAKLAREAAKSFGPGAPADPHAQARLGAVAAQLLATAQATANFHCRSTPHFRICHGNKDEVVATLAEEVLEAAYVHVGRALDFYPAERGEKITVEFYANATELAGATGLRPREIETSGTIAVCRFHRLMLLSPLATSFGYNWADTLAHEYVHLVVSKKSYNHVPVWLHEGIAKTLESAWREDFSPVLEPYPQQLLNVAQQNDTLVPLARMHPSMAKLSSQKEAALAFAEVFDLLGYMRRKFGNDALVHLLAELGSGVAWERALGKNFAPMAALESQWREDLGRRVRQQKKRGMPAVQAPPPLTLAAAGKEARAPEAARADALVDPNVRAAARLAELLEERKHVHAAAQAYAVADATAHGEVASVRFRLAQALTDDGRPNEAMAVLQQAQKRGQLSMFDNADEPQSEAQWLYARLLKQAGDAHTALIFLRAYNLHNPYNPAVHALAAACFTQLQDAAGAERSRRFAALAAMPPAQSSGRGGEETARAGARGTAGDTPPLPPRAGSPTASEAPSAAARQDAPGLGSATLTVLPPTWGPLALDGGPPQPAPLWRLELAPGRHCVHVVPPAIAGRAGARTAPAPAHKAEHQPGPAASPTASPPDPSGAQCIDVGQNERVLLRL